jgi:hypothetical protein
MRGRRRLGRVATERPLEETNARRHLRSPLKVKLTGCLKPQANMSNRSHTPIFHYVNIVFQELFSTLYDFSGAISVLALAAGLLATQQFYFQSDERSKLNSNQQSLFQGGIAILSSERRSPRATHAAIYTCQQHPTGLLLPS